MEMLKKWYVKLGLVVVVLFFLTCSGAVMSLNHVDNYELGYKFDNMSGEITRLPRAGWFMTTPFITKVHTVDLRPMQVCINANTRVLNCKLVQFNAEGLDLFLKWHGRNDYGHDSGNFEEILKSYAFDGSGKNYPFLTIKTELKPADSQNSPNEAK